MGFIDQLTFRLMAVVINPDLKITVWNIFSGVLAALIIFFALTWNKKPRKTKKKHKPLLRLVSIIIFVLVLVGAGSYFLLLQLSQPGSPVAVSFNRIFGLKFPVVKFPTTGFNPIPQVIETAKSLYVTPIDGLISLFFIASIALLIIAIYRNIANRREMDRAKNEFISIASHQLRTPVSGLSWLTEALQSSSQNLTPKQVEYVKDLSMLSKRLIVLVEDLLNVSRIQLKTSIMTEKSQIEIPGFVEEFIKEIEPYAVSKKHTVVLGKNISRPISLLVNKKSLYNVLQNLVSNAIEYSPENTAVTIDIEQKGGFIKTSVSNKGPVIPKDEQPHIFERFYRGEDAKKIKAEGTGLGLYIIKIIIEEMGGKVGFESEAGKDTMFWYTIPLEKR